MNNALTKSIPFFSEIVYLTCCFHIVIKARARDKEREREKFLVTFGQRRNTTRDQKGIGNFASSKPQIMVFLNVQIF